MAHSSLPEICLGFLQQNPETLKRRLAGRAWLAKKIRQGDPYAIHACIGGLYEAAAPIAVQGRHWADLFLGPFLLKPPPEGSSRAQAARYGFPEGPFLKALSLVPVVSHTMAGSTLKSLAKAVELIGEADLNAVRQAEANLRLRESERKWRGIFEQSIKLSCLVSPEGILLDINSAVAERWGMSKAELVGRNISELAPAVEIVFDLQRAKDAVAKAAKGQVVQYEEAIGLPDGRFPYYSISFQPIYGENSEVSFLFVEGRDITARRQMENALRASEEKFFIAFHSNPAMFAIIDFKEGRCLDVNNCFLEASGFTREEVIGKTVFELGWWAEADADHDLRRLLKDQGIVRNLEYRFRSKDGDIGYGLLNAATISLAGEPHILVAAVDITERKRLENRMRESEEQYRSLVESIRDGFFITDEKGFITFANRALGEMCGHKDPREMVGSNFSRYLAPESREQTLFRFRTFIKNRKKDIFVEEIPVVKLDGEWFLIELKAVPILEKGRVVGTRGHIRDITERKRVETELLAHRENLKELIRERTAELEREVGERERVETLLRDIQVELEQRVQERTAELKKTNARLNREIERRSKIEERLRKSEAGYRLLAENATDVIFTCDENGLISYISPTIQSLCGYSPRQMAGHSIFEYLQENDLEKKQEKFRELLGAPEAHVFRTLVRRKDNSFFWAETTFKAIVGSQDSSTRGYVAVLRDISERKTAEELICIQRDMGFSLSRTSDLIRALDLALEAALNGEVFEAGCVHLVKENQGGLELILQRNLSPELLEALRFFPAGDPLTRDLLLGEPLYLSPPEVLKRQGIRLMLGLPFQHEGKIVASLILSSRSRETVPETTRNHLESIRNQIGAAVARIRAEEELRVAHGELERKVEERTFELKRSNERLEREIEERVALQDQLIRSERLAVAGQLAASIAHEVNSPLQAIIVLLDAMGRKNRDHNELGEQIEVLKNGFANIRGTVKNLLDLTRPTAADKQLIDLNEVIRKTADLTRAYCRSNRVHLRLELSSRILPVAVVPEQMLQVFLNLINNSVEALGGGNRQKDIHGEIHIKSFQQKGKVVIEFTDNGPGIASDALHRLFDPFYTTKKTIGVGVGLSIVHSILQANGGGITVYNAPEGGAVFTIMLPSAGKETT